MTCVLQTENYTCKYVFCYGLGNFNASVKRVDQSVLRLLNAKILTGKRCFCRVYISKNRQLMCCPKNFADPVIVVCVVGKSGSANGQDHGARSAVTVHHTTQVFS